MLKRFIPLAFTSLLLLACNHKNDKPTTALDTGRIFIRATLDGDFSTTESLIYNDTLNMQNFEAYKAWFSRKPDDVKLKYKNANYVINKDSVVNDSIEIFNYSNTYMNEPIEIKTIRKNGEWKIDFKYSGGNIPNN